MAFQYPDSGPYNLAEYLVAPLPWLTASTVSPGGTNRHDFPNVTQYVTVKNTGLTGTLYVGFTSAGVGGTNRLSLVPSASITCDYRVTSLYVKGAGPCDYEVIAGLTGIKVRDLPPLSSSLPGVADADVIASIPNMSAWWDAADPTTLFQDSSFTTPATAMSHPIGGWLDKSGNGKHLTQSISARRPTYFFDPYYPPAVMGSAVDTSWMSSQGSVAITGAFTVFAVAKTQYLIDAINQGTIRFSDTQSGTNATDLLGYFVTSNGQLVVGNSAASVYVQSLVANNKVPSNKSFLFTTRSESGTFPTLRTNGVAITSGTFGAYAAPTSKPFWLNSGLAGATGNTQYHEFLVFNRRLTDAEMGTVESYLMGKWVNWATPLRIPSCSAWYDSYPGFGMHTSSTLLTSSKAPGDPVYDWIDGAGYVAGTHNRFLQTTTSLQPVITLSGSGGRRMIASDGVDDAMIGPTLASVSPSNDFTFAFAIDPPVFNAGTNGDPPDAYNNNFYISENNSNFGLYQTSLPAPRLQFNVYTSVGATIGLTASINTPYVVTCRYVSSSRMMYMSLNGLGETTLQNGGVGNVALRGILNLFGKAGLRWTRCRMGEIIAYDRSLTSAELAMLISYMKGKWGISLSMVLGMPHFQPPPPGQNSVAEYMASTTPFLTASVLLPGVLQEITFPYVTAWVAVQNVASSGSLQVGFTAQGTTGSSYLALSQSTAITCSYRLSSIFLYAPSVACSYEVIAGLTGIPIRNLTPLVTLTGTIGAI